MAVLFSDDFNRADNDALGANWNEVDGDTDIAGNTCQLNTGGGGNAGWVQTTTSAHAAVADAKATVTQLDGDAGDGGPFVRYDTGATHPTCYSVDAWGGTHLELKRHNGSETGTLLGSEATITQVDNGVIAVEAQGTGGTVTVKSSYQGVEAQSFGDTSGTRLTAAGQAGIFAWAFGATNNQGRYDNFSVEDFSGEPSPETQQLFVRRPRRRVS